MPILENLWKYSNSELGPNSLIWLIKESITEFADALKSAQSMDGSIIMTQREKCSSVPLFGEQVQSHLKKTVNLEQFSMKLPICWELKTSVLMTSSHSTWANSAWVKVKMDSIDGGMLRVSNINSRWEIRWNVEIFRLIDQSLIIFWLCLH